MKLHVSTTFQKYGNMRFRFVMAIDYQELIQCEHVLNHFTVVCSVTWHLNGSEVVGDLVLIKTSLFLLCKSSCSNANKVRINDELQRAIDDNACVILVLLDLSATSGTVDHQILLTRHKCRHGVNGNALAWMRSYPSNRFQYFRVTNNH